MTGKPSPKPNADTAEFWAACNRGELTYQVCGDCGHVQFYPRALCTACQSGRLEWRTSAGRGEVHTFTVNHRAPNEAFRQDAPYVIALVDLDEGFRMMMNVLDCPAEQVAIGMRVKVVFEDRDGQKIPQAAPER
jgi:uncharacterized OB-fold protein